MAYPTVLAYGCIPNMSTFILLMNNQMFESCKDSYQIPYNREKIEKCSYALHIFTYVLTMVK